MKEFLEGRRFGFALRPQLGQVALGLAVAVTLLDLMAWFGWGARDTNGFVIAAGLRVGVGLFMTLAVALAAWWTARMNTQASTGLLFVGLGCVLAGEVSARVLFFLTGAAV